MPKKVINFREIEMKLIDRPDEIVRLEISKDDIQDLANSIREQGLLQPVLVAPKAGRYMIVAGDRRYLAVEVLGLKKIMCHIKEMSSEDIALNRAIENIQRTDLTPFEEGRIYHALMEKRGMSLDEIAKRMGKSPGVIQRRMDILGMPETFQRALHSKKVSISVAEELMRCPDGTRREYFLELAIEHGITMMIARTWVDDFSKELRTKREAVDSGRPPSMPYQEAPIFRACDLCLGPTEYKDLQMIYCCPECHKNIMAAVR